MSLTEPVLLFFTTIMYLGIVVLFFWAFYSVVTSLRSIARSQQQMAMTQAEILKAINNKSTERN
ncbi:hypothetical protein GCM10011365_25350 [Marinicella pacifica]|jgi:hypothetical protein|uniref:Uncharacterized protein n=1 Tax=Marinicella pacifica TaxID=1171543 RepID=A0A917CZ68_9GAMM|nr:hypothetical protein [Marinicella pacifica]GGG03106.1 hypothetical protein GCM10011365_25350 [Marinicella pacifica]